MKIDATKQFQPTQQSVQGILSAYGLSLINLTPTRSGIENCTLFVTTSSGEYVLRVYRQSKKSDAEIIAEHEFVRYLGKHHIPVPPTIQNKAGEYLTKEQGWQSVLMPKIPGLHASTYTANLVENLATLQATMHLLARKYDGGGAVGKLPNTLRETIFLQHVDTASLDATARSLLKRAKDYSLTLPADLPAGLCHLDYDAENILVTHDGTVAAVLDFDDLATAPFIVCLGYTLWHIMAQENISLVHEYLDVYSSYRELNEQELSIMPAIMLFRHYELLPTLRKTEAWIGKPPTNTFAWSAPF